MQVQQQKEDEQLKSAVVYDSGLTRSARNSEVKVKPIMFDEEVLSAS